MEYARWHSESSKLVEGAPVLDHWRAAAKRGSADAIRMLEGPEFPESLAYLWTWALQLHGRSGASMAGLLPLSYSAIAHWAALTDQVPTPEEVHALIGLDAVMLSAARPEQKDDAEPKPETPWPEKKHG